MSKLKTIPNGSLLTISSGCYSDYYVRGVFKALKDIDSSALVDEWFNLHPKQKDKFYFREDEFLGWVSVSGYLQDVETWTWHIGDYSDVSEMQVDEP